MVMRIGQTSASRQGIVAWQFGSMVVSAVLSSVARGVQDRFSDRACDIYRHLLATTMEKPLSRLAQPSRYAFEEIFFSLMPATFVLLCWHFSAWWFPLHLITSFLVYWTARVRRKLVFFAPVIWLCSH